MGKKHCCCDRLQHGLMCELITKPSLHRNTRSKLINNWLSLVNFQFLLNQGLKSHDCCGAIQHLEWLLGKSHWISGLWVTLCCCFCKCSSDVKCIYIKANFKLHLDNHRVAKIILILTVFITCVLGYYDTKKAFQVQRVISKYIPQQSDFK